MARDTAAAAGLRSTVRGRRVLLVYITVCYSRLQYNTVGFGIFYSSSSIVMVPVPVAVTVGMEYFVG